MKNLSKLMGLVNVIVSELNNYTQCNTVDEVVKGRDFQSKKFATNGEAIFNYISDKNEITNLKTQRIVNIVKIKMELLAVMSSIEKNTKDLTDEELNSKLNSILIILTNGKKENTRLSLEHGKTHRSYHDNRLAGLSMFDSWWNKSWCQSHANTRLEACLGYLENFQNESNKELKVRM